MNKWIVYDGREEGFYKFDNPTKALEYLQSIVDSAKPGEVYEEGTEDSYLAEIRLVVSPTEYEDGVSYQIKEAGRYV